MSLMGEQLAEEWLNRRGYFTIRGIKIGTGEIDPLSVRHTWKTTDCWHNVCSLAIGKLWSLISRNSSIKINECHR